MKQTSPLPLNRVLLKLLVSRFFLPFLVIVAIVLICAVILLNHSLSNEQLNLATYYAGQVDDYLGQALQTVDEVASTASLHSNSRIDNFLQAILQASSYFNSLSYYDSNGELVTQVPYHYSQESQTLNKPQSGIGVSYSGGAPVITITRSVTGGGTLVAELSLTDLHRFINAYKSPLLADDVILMDQYGTLLTDQNPGETREQLNLKSIDITGRVIDQPVSFFYWRNNQAFYPDQLISSAAVRVHSTGWIILLETPAKKIFTPVFSLGGIGLLVGLFFAWLIFLALQNRFRHSITEPLISFGRAANALTHSNFDEPWGFQNSGSSFSELGVLAQDFQHMSAAIRSQQIKLKEDQERYQSLFEDSPISLWEEDFSIFKETVDQLRRDGITDLRQYFQQHPDRLDQVIAGVKVLDVNKATLNLFGANSKAELLENLPKIFGPESKAIFIDEALAIFNGGTEFSSEGVNYRLTGEQLDIALEWVVAPGYKETLSKVYVSILDVTERRRTEAVQRQWADIFKNTYMGVSVSFSDQPTIDMMNPTLASLHGYEMSELIGQHALSLVDSELIQTTLENIRLADQKGHQTYESLHVRKDGSRFPVLIDITSVKNGSGGLLYRITNVQDITERKEHERELEIIANVSNSIRSFVSQTDMLPAILEETSRIFKAPGTLFFTLDRVKENGRVILGRDHWETLTGNHFPMSGALIQSINMNQPYLTGHQADTSDFEMVKMLDGVAHIACIPLISQEQVNGAILLGRDFPFTSSDERTFLAISEIFSGALHRTKLYEKVEEQLQNLTALRSVEKAMTSSLDLQVTLQILLNQVVSQLHVDAADVLLYTPQLHLLKFAFGTGFSTRLIEQARIRTGDGVAGQVALERRLLIIRRLDKEKSFNRVSLLAEEKFISYAGVPLITKGQLKGVLEVFHRSNLEPDQSWLDMMEALASQAANAISQAELFENLQASNLELTRAYNATIEGWARALELRDNETEGHSQRVVNLTLRLAEEIGIPENEWEHIRRGALLHDIGKMAIPDEILRKPGPLSEEEWVVMRQHPIYAYELLASIPYLQPALDIPYSHHEKWDGSGYPRGLHGDEISLSARIFSVVDVWDALLSDRPYRQHWSEEKAWNYILSQSGKHFDPMVVDAFARIIIHHEQRNHE